jgi:DtxR family transcriptional regulator, Mn-dependent transcriptional regulator
MDEMLGFPSVYPHGDPIPNADGGVHEHAYHSLLECPIGLQVRVTRVTDQDAVFLRFVEQSALMPGQMVTVVSREEAADSVAIEGPGTQRIVLGARAASKVLVAPG